MQLKANITLVKVYILFDFNLKIFLRLTFFVIISSSILSQSPEILFKLNNVLFFTKFLHPDNNNSLLQESIKIISPNLHFLFIPNW